MPRSKDYSYREMIYDQCFSTGKEFTCKQLMDIVNKRLEERSMKLIQSRTTFMQDIAEMNEKFYHLYNQYGIVWEDRHKKRYYRYRYGVKSIYNRELTQEEVEKLQQVRSLLQGFKGMPQFDWIDQMMARLDQNIIGKGKEVASFEGGTRKSQELLMPLFNAIVNRQVLDVAYWHPFRDSETIVAHPYYLKQYWRRWYLFAKREGGKDVEAFALDCMESVKENKMVRTCLERIVNHSYTVIELNYEEDPTKIQLKRVGDMVDVIVTPNRFASKDQMPFSGYCRCKDVVRELYEGLLECAKAFPKEYVDGCPYTYDVVYRAINSEIIENYLKEE